MISNKTAYQLIGLVTLNAAILIGIYWLRLPTGVPQNDSPLIAERLNEVKTQLIDLQKQLKKPPEKIDLREITQDFNKLGSLIEQSKSIDATHLNQLMNENRTALTNKLDKIHESINTLNAKQHPIKYLPISALPFQVVSIDSVQQINIASVTYDFKTIPLEKGDALAGWTVLQVDFSKQRIEMENKDKEHVVVILEMNEEEEEHA